MDSIAKNNSEEQFEPVEQNVSTEEEKGSGKGKLPENQLTTTPAVSFQKAIVDSAFTRTPTISKTLQIQTSDNTSEKDESTQVTNKVLEDIVADQSHYLLIDQNKTNSIDQQHITWEPHSQEDEELLVVVVEEYNEEEDQVRLNIEEETISAATTPNEYGNSNYDILQCIRIFSFNIEYTYDKKWVYFYVEIQIAQRRVAILMTKMLRFPWMMLNWVTMKELPTKNCLVLETYRFVQPENCMTPLLPQTLLVLPVRLRCVWMQPQRRVQAMPECHLILLIQS